MKTLRPGDKATLNTILNNYGDQVDDSMIVMRVNIHHCFKLTRELAEASLRDKPDYWIAYFKEVILISRSLKRLLSSL
jgi:hypothetical protein